MNQPCCMVKPFRIGILRETRQPPDLRVPFTPLQCRAIMDKFQEIEFLVQPSSFRSYTDQEYQAEGIKIEEDLSNCDLIMGIKEVDPTTLFQGKKYLFFAHVGKKQAHNRRLLQAVLQKNVSLLDYEYLTDDQHVRVVAFGRWAGIVGAYNALRGWGIKYKLYDLKPAWKCQNYLEILDQLNGINPGPVRILLTGEGRVSSGVTEIMDAAGIMRKTPLEFIGYEDNEKSYCQIGPQHYTRHREGKDFTFTDFINNPQDYLPDLDRFISHSDVLITGHFWDPRSPVLFLPQALKAQGFRISLIADISCDIGGAVPTTIRASGIQTPYYDIDRQTLTEHPPFSVLSHILVMAVDNLPAELPRDASEDFGKALGEKVISEFLKSESEMLKRATIAEHGLLSERFRYLADFVAEK